MNVHKNARLTPSGRALLARQIEMGWTAGSAAEAAGVSIRTARKWLGWHRLECERRYHDRSSAPRRCPHQTLPQRVVEIETLRRKRMSGPQIALALGMPRSTVGVILRRLGLGRLAALDPKPPVIRYERAMPGELLHIDRDCQDFRVWAGILGKKESQYASTQGACDTERASRPVAGWRRCQRRI